MELPEERKPIREDDILYRRIPNVASADFMTTDEQTGERRPSSGAFEPDEDGVSVYIDRVLRAYRLSHEALVEEPFHGVVSLLAADISADGSGLSLVSDPWPKDVDDPKHDRNAAHALVKGLADLGKKTRRREQRRLAKRCTTIVDPSGS